MTRDTRIVAAVTPDLSVSQPIVAIGQQPWRIILENARRLNADLIVLGSHGYGEWDRVLGTTAGKVADLADRNVFIVHARAGRNPRRATLGAG